MKRAALRLILVFSSFLAVSLGLMTTASATVWKNLKSGKCLAVAGNATDNKKQGQPLVIWTCDGTPSQSFTLVQDGVYFRFVSAIVPNPPVTSLAIGVSNNNMSSNTPLITWQQNGDFNQDWEPEFVTTDSSGHSCAWITNLNNPRGSTFVMDVSAGRVDNGAGVIIHTIDVDIGGHPDFIHHPEQYWCQY